MKVAVNIQTKKIIDVLPDIATSNTPFLINNGYIMLDIENPIYNHIENEDGTVTTVFRELIEDDFKSYNEQNYKTIRQNIVDNIELTKKQTIGFNVGTFFVAISIEKNNSKSPKIVTNIILSSILNFPENSCF